MYTVSENFKTYIKSASREIKAKIEIGSKTYYEENLQDITINDGSSGSENFTIGTAYSRKVEFSLINVTDSINATDVIKPYFGLDINGTIEYVPMGVFYIDSVDKKKGITSIVAYDKMLSLEGEYVSNLTYPSDTKSILNEICSMTGITLNSTLSTTFTIEKKVTGYSYRDFIGFIASMYCGNAVFDREGKLVIKTCNTTPLDYTYTGDNFVTFEKSDSNYTVSKVICKFGDVGISKGTDTGNALIFSNPFGTESIVNSILSNANGLEFRPCKLKVQGDPSLDAGDFIKVEDLDGTIYNIVVSNMTLTYNGGLMADINCTGETSNQNVYEAKRLETKSSITEMNIKLGEIATKVAETDIDQFNERMTTLETSVTQTAGQIELKVSKTEVEDAVKNISIGGRNLLPSTEMFTDWRCNGDVMVMEDNGYFAYFPSTDTLGWRSIDNMNLSLLFADLRGREVTFSFLARSWDANEYNEDTDHGIGVAFSLMPQGASDRTLYKYVSMYSTPLSSDLTKISVTITLTDDVFNNGTGTIDMDTRLFLQIYNYSIHHVDITLPKLEFGNKATDWSPAIEDGSVKVTTSIGKFDDNGFEVTHSETKTKTLMSSSGFFIKDAYGEDLGSFGMDNGLPNIRVAQAHIFGRKMFEERRAIYVYSSTGNDLTADGTASLPYKTISSAINSMGKILTQDTWLLIAGTFYENIEIAGITGAGTLNIDMNGSTLYGNFDIKYCSAFINIYGASSKYGNIKATGSSQPINVNQCSGVKLLYMNLDGCKLSSSVINMWMSFLEASYCTIKGGTTHGMYFTTCNAYINNCKGSNTGYGIFAGCGCLIGIAGTIPTGTTSATTAYCATIVGDATPTGDTTGGGTTIITKVCNVADTGSWRSSGWRSDNERVYQGQWENYGVHKGFFFFGAGAFSAMVGKTIKSAKLRIKRCNNGGSSAKQPIYFYGHGYETQPSGEPSLGTSLGNLCSLGWGEEAIVSLPSSFLTGVSGGSIKGIAIYATSPYVILYGDGEYTSSIEFQYM